MPRFSHSQPRRNNAISTRAFEKPRLKCQAKIQVALIFLKASSSKWSGIPRNMNEMMEPNEQFHIIIETSWQHPIKLFLPCKIGKKSLPSYQTLQPSPADSPARRTPCSLRSSSPNVQPRLARVESPISFTLKCTSRAWFCYRQQFRAIQTRRYARLYRKPLQASHNNDGMVT